MRDILIFIVVVGYLCFRNSSSYKIIDSNDYSVDTFDNYSWYSFSYRPIKYHIKTIANITVELLDNNNYNRMRDKISYTPIKLYKLKPMINYIINFKQYNNINYIITRNNNNNYNVLIKYKYKYTITY
jgi:hypothetical protein